MGVALTIIIFIGILFFLIICHELAHFVAARRAGVIVEEFGIGFPPRLFSVKRGQTVYSINLIPIGAFVKPIGEDDPNVEGGLAAKGPWTRMGIYAAGPMVNLLLAFLFMAAFYMAIVKTDLGGSQGMLVQAVHEDSAAAQADIRPGDIILRIGKTDIQSDRDIRKAVNADGQSPKEVVIQRGDVVLDPVIVQPDYDQEQGRYTIGVYIWWGWVAGVDAGSPAAGKILSGDAILGINGKLVYSNESFAKALNEVAEKGDDLKVVVRRLAADGTMEIEKVSLDQSCLSNGMLVGITTEWVEGATLQEGRYSFGESFYNAGSDLVHLPYLFKKSIPLIREDPSSAVVGPIGAGQLTVEAVKAVGFTYVLYIAGLISIGFALFNFLPIPPLDGAGILIGFIEGIRRGKRLPQQAVRFVYITGTVLIIMLSVLVFYSDIIRIISGKGFPGL